MNVLVCDDHAVFAETLAHFLTAGGHHVVAVTYRPEEAVAILARTPVDVCSLDVMYGDDCVLPRLPAIRRACPDTRFVMLTGRLDASVVDAGRAVGIRGFAEKRQRAADILEVFASVATGRVVLPGAVRRVPSPRPRLSEPAQAARRLAAYLTPREREVLSALVGGADTIGLAQRLGITRATARCHIQSLLTKMNAHSRLEAATTAVRFGLLDPETGAWLI